MSALPRFRKRGSGSRDGCQNVPNTRQKCRPQHRNVDEALRSVKVYARCIYQQRISLYMSTIWIHPTWPIWNTLKYFVPESEGTDNLGHLDLDRRIILKWILDKSSVRGNRLDSAASGYSSLQGSYKHIKENSCYMEGGGFLSCLRKIFVRKPPFMLGTPKILKSLKELWIINWKTGNVCLGNVESGAPWLSC